MGQEYFKSGKNPVFFIAEIGGNHEGDSAYASRLNRLALQSGADAVKYQIYAGDTLVSEVESPDRNAHFKKFELNREHYCALAEEVIGAGAHFMASVWDAAMLSWVDPYLKIHKVGSGDLTCWPLLRLLVRTGKPIILSTGLSSLGEIAATVRFIDSLDQGYLRERKIALMQCTSAYPCPDEDINLLAMETLRAEFGLPVGFSDHSVGSLAVEAAVAMGAEIIEKHFTDSREGKVFRDHKVSLTCEEIQALMPRLRRIAAFRGSAEKSLTAAESGDSHQHSFRRSVYAARDISPGEAFSEENLTCLRPASGVAANRFDEVIGKIAGRSIRRHEVLHDSDLS
jgi:N-acetylneuraminate synthase/N,N'-diacetyllegionaminate synthase